MKTLIITLLLFPILYAQSISFRDSIILWNSQGDLSYIDQNLEVYKKGDSSLFSTFSLEQGNYEFNKKNSYNTAKKYYLQSIQYNPLKNKEEIKIQGKNHLNLSFLYQRINNEHLRIKHLEKALVYFNDCDDQCGKAFCYNKLGMIDTENLRFNKAKENFRLGLKNADKDTCMVYTDLLLNSANIEVELNHRKQALILIEKALAISISKKDTIGILSANICIIYTLNLKDDIAKVESTYNKITKISQDYNAPYYHQAAKYYLCLYYFKNGFIEKIPVLLNEVEVYFKGSNDLEILTEIYQLKRNYLFYIHKINDAFSYEEKLKSLSDLKPASSSSIQSDTILNIKRLDKKEFVLIQKEKKLEKEKKELSQQKWIYILFLVATSLIIYQVFRYQKKIDHMEQNTSDTFIFGKDDSE